MRLRTLLIAAAVIASTLTGVTAIASPAQAAGAVRCADDSTGTVAAANSDGFNPITPVRLVDTREGYAGHTGKVGASCRVEIDLDDHSQIPKEATAVALSVIAVDATQRGFLTAHPCDAERPATSNVNPRPNVPTPNQNVTPIGPSRRICVFTNVATNIVVDATGWYGESGEPFQEREPVRALDTRTANRPDNGRAIVPAKTTYRLPMAGHSVPAGAEAVTVNLTVTGAQADGWALAYPCGSDLPLASSVNYLRNEDRAGTTTVGLGPSGDLCLYTFQSAHLVVDVSAWYGGTSPSHFEPLTGVRLVDSRNGIGGWNGRLASGETRSFDLSGPGIDRYSHAAALNVIATEATGPGHLRVFPCDQKLPLTSIVNFLPGDEATNLTMTPASPTGKICVFANTATHVVIDTFGVLTTGSRMQNLTIAGRESFPNAAPDANDYAMYCGAGQNDITISANPSRGATVRFGGDITNGKSPRKVTMKPDDLAKVTFSDSSGSESFYIRCLPPTFPTLRMDRPGEAAPGYYMVSHGAFVSPPAPAAYVAIVDEYGVPLWYKTTDAPVIRGHLRPNGNLAWTELLGQGYGSDPTRGFEIHRLDGSLVRELKTVGSPTDHHDLVALDNGNNLLITYRLRANVDLTSLGAGFGANENVLDAELQEQRPNGTVVWTWNSKDHIDLSETTNPVRRTGPSTQSGNEIDLVHVNSMFETANGNLVISARNTDSVFMINRSNGKIVWKLGGKPNPIDNAKLLDIRNDPWGGPLRQHDARQLPDGSISLFDNGDTTRPSRATIYAINPGAGTARLTWERRDPQGRFAFGLGSLQVESDGSKVIGWGPLQPVIEDVGADDKVDSTFTWLSGAPLFQAPKYPLSAFNAGELRNNAGGAVEPA